MRVRVSAAEEKVMNAVAIAAERVRGSNCPDWYVRALVERLVDEAWLPFHVHDDVAARAFFILRRFSSMEKAIPKEEAKRLQR